MFINKLNEADETGQEICGVHSVCSERKVYQYVSGLLIHYFCSWELLPAVTPHKQQLILKCDDTEMCAFPQRL